MSRIRAKKKTALENCSRRLLCVCERRVYCEFCLFRQSWECNLPVGLSKSSHVCCCFYTLCCCAVSTSLCLIDCYMFTFTAVNCLHVFSRLCIKANSIKMKTRWAERWRFFSGFIPSITLIVCVNTFVFTNFNWNHSFEKIHIQRSSLMHKNTLQAQKTCLPSTTIHMKYF